MPRDQVELLLESSKLLHDSKKYSLSIPLSILALEECAKLNLFSRKVYQKRGVSQEEWSSLSKGGSHDTKLTRPLTDSKKELLQKGEKGFQIVKARQQKLGSVIKYTSLDEIVSAYAEEANTIKVLNKIKKLCLYVDWKEGNWQSLVSNFTTRQKKILSRYLLTYVGFVFNNELLGMKYPHFPHEEQSLEYRKFINDPLWKQAKELEKLITTNEFRKNQLIASSLFEKM